MGDRSGDPACGFGAGASIRHNLASVGLSPSFGVTIVSTWRFRYCPGHSTSSVVSQECRLEISAGPTIPAGTECLSGGGNNWHMERTSHLDSGAEQRRGGKITNVGSRVRTGGTVCDGNSLRAMSCPVSCFKSFAMMYRFEITPFLCSTINPSYALDDQSPIPIRSTIKSALLASNTMLLRNVCQYRYASARAVDAGCSLSNSNPLLDSLRSDHPV